MLISILKGQYDSFIGNEDTIFLKQQSFKGEWKDLFVFVERNDKMVWQYVSPRLLFLPWGDLFQLWHSGGYTFSIMA